MDFPIDAVRARFPALARGDRRRIYFDAPGGTQICQDAIDRMVEHLTSGTANSGGAFVTSRETDALSDAAHQAVADLLDADPGEIAFGPNMTSLTLALSRAISRDWDEGDELVLTHLDHDANVAPWLLVARDRKMIVKWIDFDPDTGLLDLGGLSGLLSPRTRLVAVGGASNALGTLNDIKRIAAIVKAGSQALLFVDAVQSVPHVPTDVRDLGCDFLACSPYKFFGPHQGVLWGKAEVLAEIEAYKVRPADANPPAHRFETGTPSFEAQGGVLGTIDYLDWLGGHFSDANSRPERLRAAMTACIAYEQELGARMLAGFATIPGLKVWGRPTMDGRVPTFAITIEGHHPDAVAATLAEQDIFVWSGHFYAVEVIARLGLEEAGGLIRIGLCHYSTAEEVDRLIAALRKIASAH
ncbi:MAG TPA: cysteine desulfurase-like protein [Sphingomonas sp.]|uniref:cysteine desulfurase-like protein n=1 Tax=Sphingomonas sp. TaxID=28214 RepID=UPI002B81608F|nr:cysteine desulfurase-like protein [Sphingomonas sp.]HMI18782.1 cysteine desulfurase-like protein [Sphingomonas sp.]